MQREWWHHRYGCEVWFLAERDTRTNEVQPVELPARRRNRRRMPTGRLMRLPPQPGERIDRSRRGHVHVPRASRCAAYEGDTIGSALFAAGQRVFSRSFKYHRPRGLLCVLGQLCRTA